MIRLFIYFSFVAIVNGTISTKTYSLSLDGLVSHIKLSIPTSSSSCSSRSVRDNDKKDDVTIDAAIMNVDDDDCVITESNNNFNTEEYLRLWMFPRDLAETMTSQIVGIVLKLYYETHSKVYRGNEHHKLQFTNAQRSVEQRCYHSNVNIFCSVNHSNNNSGIQLHATTSFSYTKNKITTVRMDMTMTISSADIDETSPNLSSINQNVYSTIQHHHNILLLLSRDILVQSIPRILSSLRINDTSSSLSWYIQKRHSDQDYFDTSTISTNDQTHTFKYSNLDDLLKDSSMQGRMRIDNPSNYVKYRNDNNSNEDVNIVDVSRIQVWAYPSMTQTDNDPMTAYTKLLFIDSQLVCTNTMATNIHAESMFQPAIVSHPKFKNQTKQHIHLAIISNRLLPMAYIPQILSHFGGHDQKHSKLHLEIVGTIPLHNLLSKVVKTHFPNMIPYPSKHTNKNDDSCESFQCFLDSFSTSDNKDLFDPISIKHPTRTNSNHDLEEWIKIQLRKHSIQSSSMSKDHGIEKDHNDSQHNLDKFDILFVNLSPPTSISFDNWIVQEYTSKWMFLLQNKDSMIVLNHNNNQNHLITLHDHHQHRKNLIQLIQNATNEQKARHKYKDNADIPDASNVVGIPEIIFYQESLAYPLSENFMFIFPGGKESSSYQKFIRTDPIAIDKDACLSLLGENDFNYDYNNRNEKDNDTLDNHVNCGNNNKFYSGIVHVERILALEKLDHRNRN